MTNDDNHSADHGTDDGERRRLGIRHAVRMRIDYRMDESDRDYVFEYSRNISDGGIFLECQSPAPVGTILDLRFPDSEHGAGLECQGEVMWVSRSSDDSGMGIRFLNDEDGATRTAVAQLIRRIAVLP